MKIKAIIGLLGLFLLFTHRGFGQELNVSVTVFAPQVSNMQPEVFERLQSTIKEFLNTRKWTDKNYALHERIECSIQLTISEVVDQTQYRGSMQLQAIRPIYGSDYNSPTFAANDNNVDFIYLENTLMQFSMDQHRDNLSSMLAYYAYMIIGTDEDTYSLNGGTDSYVKAQTIVANAQNAGQQGWKASENTKNRFWLVENILSQTFSPLRKCLYNYHLNGFDIMYKNAEAGRTVITSALEELRSIHRIKPSSYNLQMFFFAKSNELIKLYSKATDEEKTQVQSLLKLLDPGNIQKYEAMTK